MKSREQIIQQARQLAAEIEHLFASTAHWNRCHPHELPIDPDPDGELAALLADLRAQLADDVGVGPIPPLGGWVGPARSRVGREARTGMVH